MNEGEGAIDLSPRKTTRSSVPRWIPGLVLLAVAGTIIGLIWFLATNSQSFLEADQAVAEREELGDKRFQLLGSPISSAGPEQTLIIGEAEYTFFTIAFDDVYVDVVSRGHLLTYLTRGSCSPRRQMGKRALLRKTSFS